MISKWGFNGSSGNSEYKQKLGNESSDASVFITSFVPIQIICYQSVSQSKIVWQNPPTFDSLLQTNKI